MTSHLTDPKPNHSQLQLQPQPWNLLATLLWSLAIGGVFVGLQFGIAKLYIRFRGDSSGVGEISSQLTSLQSNSTLISIMTVTTAIVCSSVIYLAVRKSRIEIREYLGLKPVGAKHVIGWVAALLIFSLLSNLIATQLDQDIVTDFARDLYNNAENMFLLAIAVVIAGPLFEELFFRGFIYFGISRSRLSVVGAILITALIWTVIHGQYDWYVRSNIFVIGIMFGVARYKSGSILPPLTMHMVMNGLALVEVANL